MSVLDNNFYEDFGNSDGSSGGGATLLDEEGSFVVRVTDATLRASKKDRAKLWLNVTFEVVETSVPTVVPKGCIRGFIHNVYDPYYGASGLKAWVAAMLGYQPGSEDAKTLGFVRDPEKSDKDNMAAFKEHNDQLVDMLTGEAADYDATEFLVRLKTTAGVSKAGKHFVRKDWSPWTPE